jgi:hypothetical protein
MQVQCAPRLYQEVYMTTPPFFTAITERMTAEPETW